MRAATSGCGREVIEPWGTKRERSFNRTGSTELPTMVQCERLLGEIATGPEAPPVLRNDRPLHLYGRGNLGRMALEFCEAVGQPVCTIFDRNDLDYALLDGGDRVAVAVVAEPYAPIERKLGTLSVAEVVPFYDLAQAIRDNHPLSNGWVAGPLDENSVLNVLARWADDVSRAHHLQFIAWRRLREEWTFEDAPVTPGNRYFIPEVADVLHDHEVFLDGGAHHGEVLALFARLVGYFKQIVMFEPDTMNMSQLLSTDALSTWQMSRDSRVDIRHQALAAVNGVAQFAEGFGYCSRLSASGNVTLTTRTIDSLAVRPTFVKLHLEGGELAALKGAERTLVGCRPIVAATVYHNEDGVWRTAAWLMERLSDYRFYFRNHGWCGTGAVVYAVPGERYA